MVFVSRVQVSVLGHKNPEIIVDTIQILVHISNTPDGEIDAQSQENGALVTYLCLLWALEPQTSHEILW